MSFLFPIYMTTQGEYRLNEKMVVTANYAGNLNWRSRYNFNDVRYTSRSNELNLGLGRDGKIAKNNRWFIMGSIGFGGAGSTVFRGSIDSVEFVYKGRYNQVLLTPGIIFNAHKKTSFAISLPQSMVNFSSYSLPEITYKNKFQYIVSQHVEVRFNLMSSLRLSYFISAMLNATAPGTRNNGEPFKADIWRVIPFGTDLKLTYIHPPGKRQ